MSSRKLPADIQRADVQAAIDKQVAAKLSILLTPSRLEDVVEKIVMRRIGQAEPRALQKIIDDAVYGAVHRLMVNKLRNLKVTFEVDK